MRRHQVRIVQSTFARFNSRLFERAPEVQRGGRRSLVRKLASALASAFDGLTRLEELEPALEAMGRRHAPRGVSLEDYEAVGQALLATLREGLGAMFTQETREAWMEAYVVVATAMQRSAREAAA